jgi:hypothetical protein
MNKALAALGAGEARTWPCGPRAPLGQPWQNRHTHTTTESGLLVAASLVVAETRRAGEARRLWGGARACAAPHAR